MKMTTNLIGLLKQHWASPRNDGMLHFSQHLQHDRHAVLAYTHGYPSVELPWSRVFPLVQGTGIHDLIHQAMDSLFDKYQPEVWIGPYHTDLGHTWVGTADAYVEIDGQAWLLDYKTISGPGALFLDGKPKDEHILQVSAYYHFGPMQNCKTAVVYFPTGPDYHKRWQEPMFLPFEPMHRVDVHERMVSVENAIFTAIETGVLPDAPKGEYVWKKQGKTWKLIYRPHYTTMFCPWGSLIDDPCGCSQDEGKLIATYKDKIMSFSAEYATIVEQVGLPDEGDGDNDDS